MEHNNKQDSLMKDLLLHTIALKEKIESIDVPTRYTNNFVKILQDIVIVLSVRPLDLDRLRRDKFGISRMIDGLAETTVEQELLSLHEEIYNLLKVSKETDDSKQ